MKQPHGVVWDLGNVLIDWAPYAAIAAGVGADEAARFLAAEDFDFRAYNHRPDTGWTWAEAEAQVARTHPHWLRHAIAYREHFPLSLRGEVPGSVEILRALHAEGLPMWGLTNWSAELFHHAPASFAFLDLLEDIIVSGVEKVAKPDPRVFEILAARTGRRLEGLVFVDDRADNVAAAAEAGMDAIVFTDSAALHAELSRRALPV